MIPNKKVLHVVNISFVLPYFIGDQFDFFSKKGITFHVACQPSKHFTEYATEKNFIPVGANVLREINFIEDLKAIFFLTKYIKKERITIVIGHTPKGGLIAMIAGWLAGAKKRVYFRHGIMFETSKGFKRIVLKSIEQITGFLATQVVCVSPSVIEVSNEQSLNNPSKNVLLHKGTCNGIDILRYNRDSIALPLIKELKEKYKISDACKIIGYTGRLVNDKGINELIGAWKIVKIRYPLAKLLLVGPFEVRDSLSEEVRNIIISDESIIHTGLVYNTEAHYALMDIFILPSHREGFGQVNLEAASMKLPVLTTNVTGCKNSILDGVTGIFITNQPEDIAEKIGFYLDNPEIAKTHGCNGRAFVSDNFRQEVVWAEIEKKVYNHNLEA